MNQLQVFIAVVIVSAIPFYFGYFLMLYRTSRNVKISDVFHFRITKRFRWSFQQILGLVIHLVGRVAPYLYILIYVQSLAAWIYALVAILMVLSIFAFLKKRFLDRRAVDMTGVTIAGYGVVEAKYVPILWKIYNDTFEPINKISPCRQSFDHAHFLEVMADPTVWKYVLSLAKGDSAEPAVIGIALVTNNFKNLPWISWEYFQEHFPDEFAKKLIYYFIGLAIDRTYRGNSYSISLIEHIIDDIPQGGIMGFDHSRNINPMLHHFTRIVHQAKSIRRLHLDRQHYHMVRRK